jgi:hypothetical protein
MGMSADPIDSVFQHGEQMQQPAWRKALPWVVIAAIIAALVGGLVWGLGLNTGKSHATPLPKNQVDVSQVPATVKLPADATRVARTFIQTAVARKNLGTAYSLVTDEIRQGQTLKEWLTGNIAVIPYAVSDIKYAPMKIDFSYPKEAQIEVAMLPKAHTKAKSALFVMDLVKRNGKWLVNSWVPGTHPAVPAGDQQLG